MEDIYGNYRVVFRPIGMRMNGQIKEKTIYGFKEEKYLKKCMTKEVFRAKYSEAFIFQKKRGKLTLNYQHQMLRPSSCSSTLG